MGALEAQEKNLTAADQHLEKAIQIYPNHARSLQLLGELYNQQDRGKDAVPLLEKAVALQDGSWRSHWDMHGRDSGQRGTRLESAGVSRR